MIARRLRQLVIVLYSAVVLMSMGMVGAAIMNDHAISSNPGRALARVTNEDWLRTTVEFQDERGMFHVPPSGLLYPSDLGVGQRVWVNYSTDNPNLVKVEGRNWTLAIIPALSVLSIATAIGAGLWWFIGHSSKIRTLDTLSQPARKTSTAH
ncbi:hypothetical protein CCICO_01075 [Corynebacterium ciconiae DSM 44920]|uniref:DUF3592 domain-containing protein n=1 Tax=Corynebacterium ciconiae TaxID=227319 RepID=UPI000379E0C6|nr:DUF3592 domain-containing protein [Corynebacterium ciconiae]WKD60273.1 hypothetical protein CCICO_01075 [Corynebacterium ciconiae DSM 44920]